MKKLGSERSESVKSFLKDIVFYVAGAVLYAASVDIFTAPNNIAPGGLIGVATMVNHLTDLPIGTVVMALNVPIFIMGFFAIGKSYMLKSLFCTVMSSVAIDLLALVVPVYKGEPLLAAIFGGVLSGAGLGLVFIRGSSTGGTDIIARVLGKYKPHITQGKMILIFDFIVICGAAWVYGFEQALFAVIMVYVSTKVIDIVLYGSGDGNVLFIVTGQPDVIKAAVMSSLDRGVTVLKGEGAYSGAQRDVLMCAVAPNEVYKIRVLVKKADPKAFMIVGKADQILGEGFKSIERNEFGEKIQ